MSRALIVLAEDFEELEAVTVMDLLVRAGVEVVRAGLQPGPVRASRNTVIVPDCPLDQVMDDTFDAVVLPGGLPGADHLAADERVLHLIRRQVSEHRLMAAICAAPRALVAAGVVEGKRICCYPHSLDNRDTRGALLVKEPVCVDLPLLTSRGPGTAMDFALQIIEILKSKTERAKVEAGLVRG